jgi:hypothetical protein
MEGRKAAPRSEQHLRVKIGSDGRNVNMADAHNTKYEAANKQNIITDAKVVLFDNKGNPDSFLGCVCGEWKLLKWREHQEQSLDVTVDSDGNIVDIRKSDGKSLEGLEGFDKTLARLYSTSCPPGCHWEKFAGYLICVC